MQDNLRVEFFRYGDLLGALNWHTTQNSSDINVEYPKNNEQCSNAIKPSDEYELYETGEFPDYYSGTNGSSERAKYSSHLSEVLGWDIESEEYDGNYCNIQRLWSTSFDEEHVTTKIYEDYYLNYGQQLKDRRAMFQENIVIKNNSYEYKLIFFDYRSYNSFQSFELSGIVDNSKHNKTVIQLKALDIALELEIDKIEDESRQRNFRVKAMAGRQKFLNGKFYDLLKFTPYVDEVLNNIVPSYLTIYSELSHTQKWLLYNLNK